MSAQKPIWEHDEDEETFFSALNNGIKDLSIPLPPCDVESLPLIYIVGAPRSGTTVLSQVLAKGLNVGYINNLIARFWEKPSVGIQLSKRLLKDDGRDFIDFASTHGITDNIGNLHEFGYFWTKWLNLKNASTHHLTDAELKSVDAKGLKHALENELLCAYRKPVLMKNIICGFHAEFLTNLHEKSLFIFIERDNVDTASSILNVRKQRLGDYSKWWSLKPSTFPFEGENYNDGVYQVAKQVIDCKKEFVEELEKPSVNSLFISYEQLCETPAIILKEVCEKLVAMGCSVEQTKREMNLKYSSSKPLDGAIAENLDKALKELPKK